MNYPNSYVCQDKLVFSLFCNRKSYSIVKWLIKKEPLRNVITAGGFFTYMLIRKFGENGPRYLSSQTFRFSFSLTFVAGDIRIDSKCSSKSMIIELQYMFIHLFIHDRKE